MLTGMKVEKGTGLELILYKSDVFSKIYHTVRRFTTKKMRKKRKANEEVYNECDERK